MATLETWNPEDEQFWKTEGNAIAQRTLWVSIPNLFLAFAVWIYWSVIIGLMQSLHDEDPRVFAFRFGAGDGALSSNAYQALLYTLPAVAGLSGAILRIPNAFMVALCGGRNTKLLTTILLILPALGTGFALQNPNTDFRVFVVLAALSGIGGGAFACSMSNISFYFPRHKQGLALGLNAGLGNLGVAGCQLLIPWIVTIGIFGGQPYTLGDQSIWIHNAGFVWVPILGFAAVLVALFMNNLPQHRCTLLGGTGRYLWLELIGFAGVIVGTVLLLLPWGGAPQLVKVFVIMLVSILVTLALMRYATPRPMQENLNRQVVIFHNKHNWIMTYLYVMTFGSFIGYSSAFPKLLKDVFGYIRVDAQGNALAEPLVNPAAPNILKYAFLGAAMGAAIRPLGGWLADKFGGARVTQWDTVLMILAAISSGICINRASNSTMPETYFLPFLLLFVLLFATTGIGNGSTFRMIPVIFSREHAGPVLGWTSAVAAFGAFLIPNIFAGQIRAGTPERAMYGFALYYVSCLALNWWYYARKNAETPC